MTGSDRSPRGMPVDRDTAHAVAEDRDGHVFRRPWALGSLIAVAGIVVTVIIDVLGGPAIISTGVPPTAPSAPAAVVPTPSPSAT